MKVKKTSQIELTVKLEIRDSVTTHEKMVSWDPNFIFQNKLQMVVFWKPSNLVFSLLPLFHFIFIFIRTQLLVYLKLYKIKKKLNYVDEIWNKRKNWANWWISSCGDAQFLSFANFLSHKWPLTGRPGCDGGQTSSMWQLTCAKGQMMCLNMHLTEQLGYFFFLFVVVRELFLRNSR